MNDWINKVGKLIKISVLKFILPDAYERQSKELIGVVSSAHSHTHRCIVDNQLTCHFDEKSTFLLCHAIVHLLECKMTFLKWLLLWLSLTTFKLELISVNIIAMQHRQFTYYIACIDCCWHIYTLYPIKWPNERERMAYVRFQIDWSSVFSTILFLFLSTERNLATKTKCIL